MNNINFFTLSRQKPDAIATIKGSPEYAQISGKAFFYQTKAGVFVIADITGLPTDKDMCKKPVFAMHIHSGNSCTGNDTDYFADAMGHYNPYLCPHPYHAGDMPPLFSANGTAFAAFLTDRFSVNEIIGKTVIIHSAPDDFTSQPAGNSGIKIACGVIKR